ncbi:Gfo/Idh/MocA family protein [Shouchella patagoniensis]|uniref:Gfo/Idh/MocA family protein n=1 Tax=Shouchella patagoniensis TaxID=228576 RepID=UPI0009953D5B|nr:Gfo/Idh/MocA family oxidoreductase [Shouchella patagoniensis]
MGERIRIGVIGAGSISDMHLNSYAESDEAELIAICDLNEERAKKKAALYSAKRTYVNYKDLLADPEIDAVSICTWNNSHAEITIDALHAGKDVLVEKPLTTSVEKALKVEEAVKETGKKLQVGFVRRYASNTELIKTFVDQGDLGDIYYARGVTLRRLGNPGGWFADKERSGGGPLLDVGIHVIDVLWYLMGRPKVKSISGNVYSHLGNRANVEHKSFYKAADYDPTKNSVEDFANALIRFENGASMSVDVSYTIHAEKDEVSAKLYGTKGGAVLEPKLELVSEKYNTMLNILPQVDTTTLDVRQAFQNEIDWFLKVCQGQEETRSPVEDGIEMMKILCGIYEASEQQKEIVFEEFPHSV